MSDVMLAAVHALGTALVCFVWQGCLLGLTTAAVLALLRNARPQTRYAIACAALSLCVVLPLWTFLASVGIDDDDAISDFALDAIGDSVVVGNGLAILTAWVQAHMTAIVAAWALCVSVLGMRMVFGLAWVARISATRRSTGNSHWQARVNTIASSFGVDRTISLRVVQDLKTPATVGWLRPVILVPLALICTMPPDLLEALLAHEVAHIRRFDYVVNLMQCMVEATLFYHPAVWWISNRIRAEREQIADDLAAGILGEPRRLALALHELESIQFSTTNLALAAHGGNLMVRIKRLIRPEVRPLDWKAAIPVVSLIIAGCVFYANAALATPATSASASADSAQTAYAALVDLNTCKPTYPAQSIDRAEEGTVRIQFEINSHGHLVRSKVVKSSGHPLLDDAAATGLKVCTFKAGRKNGKPIASSLTVDYVWKLGD